MPLNINNFIHKNILR